MPNHQLIQLIYNSAMQQGAFLDLMEQMNASLNNENHDQEEALLDHFQQSAAISERISALHHQKTVAETIIQQMETGILLLDADSQIIFTTPQAERFLNQNKELRKVDQKLRFTSRENNHELLKSLQAWSHHQHAPAQTLLIKDQNHIEQIVLLSPVTHADELLPIQIPSAATAILFISSPSTNRCETTMQRLQQLYQLTPAEADISCRLTSGQTVDTIASERNCKPGTIRTYIKSILSKTGTKRQSALIAMVLRAPLQVSLSMQQGLETEGQECRLQLANGRDIAFRSYGPDDGDTLICCHCSLSSRFETPLDISPLFKYKIRLIVPDRAGIGLSDGPAYQDLSGFGADLQKLLNHLQLDKVKLIGTVAGGAHALATAYHYPELVDEILLLDAFAPGVVEHSVPGAPAYYRLLPRLAQRFPRVTEALLKIVVQELSQNWEKTYHHLSKLFNQCDAEILLHPQVRRLGIKLAAECTRQSPQALVRDMTLVHGDWGIELKAIQQRCHIVYGNTDPVITAYAEQLRQQLPNNRSYLREGEGFAAMLFLNLFEILTQTGWMKRP